MNGKILVELQEWMGSDISIANAAWTSTYDKEKRENKYNDLDKISELISRLIKEGHGTTIESVVFRFWIKMPTFTDRQHVTHRICSHNGLSHRYRTAPEEWFSLPEDVKEIFDKSGYGSGTASVEYEYSCRNAFDTYKKQLQSLKQSEKDNKISNQEFKRAREIIRAMLPTAGMTERTTIMNLRSFANYQFQRNSPHAQKEIRTVAQLMLEEVKKANVAPIAISTLEEIGWKL